NGRIKKMVNIESDNEANLRSHVTKCLQAFRTVFFYRMEKKVGRMLTAPLVAFTKSASDTNKVTSLYNMLNSSSFTTSQVIVLVIASFAVFAGVLTIGGLMGLMNVYGRILASVNNLSRNLPKFSKYQ